MSTIAFDTHALIESLIKDGIEKKQAESIIKAIQVSREFDMNNLATKGDIAELKLNIVETKNELLGALVKISFSIGAILCTLIGSGIVLMLRILGYL